MPARTALNDGLLDRSDGVLDYGSGRGQDVARLRLMGVDASGWDPYFENEGQPSLSGTVLLTYVLNVIEDPAERRSTLEEAWSLTSRVLAVATRLTWDSRRVKGEQFADGVVTSRETFQHLFTPAELRSYVSDITGVRTVAAAPGLVYAFRTDQDRLAYMARRTLPGFDWQESSDYASALASVVGFVEQRGRLPLFEEIPADVLPTLGRLSPNDLSRLVMKAADPERIALAGRRVTLDTLLYLGIDLFNGRAPLSAMPLEVRADIRKYFQSYREACQRADRLLLKLRDDQYLRGAMRNSVGKLTPTALYVHHRAIHRMPVILRLYEHCGSVAAGRPSEFELIKLHHDRRAVSWLGYPDFDKDPHPRTAWSYQVTFPSLETSYTDYASRENRPLLHRKEEFLADDDPLRAKFARLTHAEVAAGLYSDPSRIGTEAGWNQALNERGLQLRGHRLVKRSP